MLTHALPKPLTIANILELAFPNASSFETDTAAKERHVYVVPQGSEPRWIIVGEPHRVLGVLRSWNPWNAASRLRWGAVKFAASARLLPMLPGVQSIVFQIQTAYWRSHLPEFPEEWNVVIHVGNPSYTRKAIVFFVAKDGSVKFAAKAPLVVGADAAIMNEAAMLNLVKGLMQVPRVVFQDSARSIVAQTWLEGRPVSRGFTDAHLDLLSLLANSGRSVKISDYRAEISSELEKTDLPFDRAALARALEFLDFDAPLQSFVEHRDFAPWNLKWVRNGELGLLDWEWSVSDGLPWQDACRFFFLEDAHFSGNGRVWEAITTNEFLLKYRQRFDIPSAALPALTMRYLLGVLTMDWKSGNEGLARYTFGQIA